MPGPGRMGGGPRGGGPRGGFGGRRGGFGGPRGGFGGPRGGFGGPRHMPPPPPPHMGYRRRWFGWGAGYGRPGCGCLGCCVPVIATAVLLLGGVAALLAYLL